MTEAQKRALTILYVPYGEELTPTQFARKMWPDSKGWNKVSNQGNGATSGKGMWLSAGSYLAKLSDKNLVVQRIIGNTRCWRISIEGKKLLESNAQ